MLLGFHTFIQGSLRFTFPIKVPKKYGLPIFIVTDFTCRRSSFFVGPRGIESLSQTLVFLIPISFQPSAVDR